MIIREPPVQMIFQFGWILCLSPSAPRQFRNRLSDRHACPPRERFRKKCSCSFRLCAPLCVSQVRRVLSCISSASCNADTSIPNTSKFIARKMIFDNVFSRYDRVHFRTVNFILQHWQYRSGMCSVSDQCMDALICYLVIIESTAKRSSNTKDTKYTKVNR